MNNHNFKMHYNKYVSVNFARIPKNHYFDGQAVYYHNSEHYNNSKYYHNNRSALPVIRSLFML